MTRHDHLYFLIWAKLLIFLLRYLIFQDNGLNDNLKINCYLSSQNCGFNILCYFQFENRKYNQANPSAKGQAI